MTETWNNLYICRMLLATVLEVADDLFVGKRIAILADADYGYQMVAHDGRASRR